MRPRSSPSIPRAPALGAVRRGVIPEGRDVNPATHASTESGLGSMNSGSLTSNTPDTRLAADADRKCARRFTYGIASVFSIMLILIMTLGVMLWAR